MYIESVAVKGLHQVIDADLNFQSDLGIIVGINGAGKTSIINLMAHLVRLNIPELLRISFESIAIKGRNQFGKLISITATKKHEALSISATESRKKIGEFVCPAPSSSDIFRDQPEERASWERYLRRATIEVSTSPLAEFLRLNVRLTLVKLDRTLFAEDFTGAVAIEQSIGSRSIRRSPEGLDPISQVEKATRERYIEYQSQLKRLNEELTNKLVLQLFQATDVFTAHKPRLPSIIDRQQILRLEDSIKKSSFYPKSPRDQGAIAEYFRITELLAAELGSKVRRKLDSDNWQEKFMISALERFQRLNMLASEFDRFDSSAGEAYRDVRVYLDSINGFLKESSKEAFFSDLDNTLRFRIVGERTSTGRPISELSSGERQIVTVLAYLAYLAGENSIFLIDEPELSLHISWQVGLLGALKSVQPKGCQLILATHSPEIVGDEREKVVRLIPKYRARQV